MHISKGPYLKTRLGQDFKTGRSLGLHLVQDFNYTLEELKLNIAHCLMSNHNLRLGTYVSQQGILSSVTNISTKIKIVIVNNIIIGY